jgi:hypothetical protein
VQPTRTAIEYRDGTLAASPPATIGVDAFARELSEGRTRLATEMELDDVLADSFPASDPPSWNPGITRPMPIGDARTAPLSRPLTDADDARTR